VEHQYGSDLYRHATGEKSVDPTAEADKTWNDCCASGPCNTV